MKYSIAITGAAFIMSVFLSLVILTPAFFFFSLFFYSFNAMFAEVPLIIAKIISISFIFSLHLYFGNLIVMAQFQDNRSWFFGGWIIGFAPVVISF